MKRSSIFLFASMLFYISLSACQRRNCASTIATRVPTRAEQQQLWDLLVSGAVQHATYEVLRYNDSGANACVDVLIYGENLCGVLQLDLIQNEPSLKSLIDKKGMGFSGVVLEKPFIRAESTPAGTRYVLNRVEGIRD